MIQLKRNLVISLVSLIVIAFVGIGMFVLRDSVIFSIHVESELQKREDGHLYQESYFFEYHQNGVLSVTYSNGLSAKENIDVIYSDITKVSYDDKVVIDALLKKIDFSKNSISQRDFWKILIIKDNDTIEFTYGAANQYALDMLVDVMLHVSPFENLNVKVKKVNDLILDEYFLN